MHNGYAGKTVPMAKDCIGSDVEKMVNGLQEGEVFLIHCGCVCVHENTSP
jgi:3-phosphoglycerate kinase